eukprot:7504453-Karenia_brevis.AAC.1
MRVKMLYRVINASESSPLKTVTFQDDTLFPIDIGKRRTGKPRVKWVDKTIEHAWRRLVNSEYTQYRYTPFDYNNDDHIQ